MNVISSTKAPTAETIWCSMGGWLRARYWQTKNLSVGTGDDELWYELAQEVTARVIAPHLFIKAQFYHRRGHTRPPSPQGLLHRTAFKRYEDYRRKNRERLLEEMEIEFSGQQSAMRTQIGMQKALSGTSMDDAIRHALRMEPYPFSPLFCFLLTRDRDELARHAEDNYFGAVLQYVPLQPEYDEVWGTHIPSDFRSEAPRAYSGLFCVDRND
jgi:hypothetical protein